MPAMTEIHPSSLRPSIPDIYDQDEKMSTSPESFVATDFDDLSPLDALAAQGRLLNKRLTQQVQNRSESPPRTTNGVDEAMSPEAGISDIFETGKTNGYQRRNRLPEKRKPTGSDRPEGTRSPAESLSLATLTLLSPPRSTSSPTPTDLARSESQSSSVLSLSTSSDGSDTPTETYLASRIYQPPPKADPPKLRPIIKTQHLPRSRSPAQSPTSSANRTPVDSPPFPRAFSPETAKTLDRPRLPSLQFRSDKSNHNGRTPSINFSRPYSSRSSAYSEASSVYEVDYFSPLKVSPSALSPDDHLSVPTSGTDSPASSPGLAEEDYKKLPRGRRKARPVLDTGIFFHSTSMKRKPSGHRWRHTSDTPTNETEDKFSPSPRDSKESLSTKTFSTQSSIDIFTVPLPPQVLRPGTSSSTLEVPRTRETRSLSQSDIRHSSTSFSPKSQGSSNPRTTLQVPGEFNSTTQIVNRTRSTTISVTPVPTASMSLEDHLNLGIKFHEQDFLPQSTHHFKLAAEGGLPTGMLFYSLSLRHGWGCAPNPEKAVEWLHSAAECASADVDENGMRADGRSAGGLEIKSEEGKKRSATLALAVYELGQSYMHGWGVQKDKHLALRCYEISANFGDADGQCETAWCYLHGIGTKKNTKMAARYYRMAEKQGVKSVGLSWIWKEKYDEKEGEENVIRRGSSMTDEIPGSGNAKKGKKLFNRNNTT